MSRSRLLAGALAVAAGLGMLGPASQAIARPEMVEPGCIVTDATLSWGFKESFRAYIESDIANGEWTTSGAATYETPDFIWSDGQGSYDPETGEAFIQFLGTVRFTGHDGLLDTTIADPAISISGDGAVLILDVSGPSMEGEQIDAQDVSFVELLDVAMTGDGARLGFTSPTVLTADGESAFPDYPADTEFDPAAVVLELDNCSPAGYVVDQGITPPVLLARMVALGALAAVAAGLVALVVVLRRRARA